MRSNRSRATGIVGFALLVSSLGSAASPYRSPQALAFSPDGHTLAVADHTAGAVVLIDVATARVDKEIAVDGQPIDVTWWPDGSRLGVSEWQAGTVAEIDPVGDRVTRRFEVGAWPASIAAARRSDLLATTDFAFGTLVLTDRRTGQNLASIPAGRQPIGIALTPDERLAVVSNFLPAEPATNTEQAACVSVVDLEDHSVRAIRLPAGASNVRTAVFDPDGAYAYVVHTVGRTQLPTTQVERGWVNTNALSVIDLGSRERVATILLDAWLMGAANPWGAAIAPDGRRLWITLSGTHELATIDLHGLRPLLQERAVALEHDLAGLYSADVIRRHRLPGNGPRGVAVSPDGRTLAVAMYFSGHVVLLDAERARVRSVISLPNQPEPDTVRIGERIFHDATYCKQQWLSCATCHADGRMDGQNWDLLNDGLGNPKNTRSLVWSHKTPPVMSLGVRATMEVASAAGFRHIAFQAINDADLSAVIAYLRSLTPVRSPYHCDDGSRAQRIQRGRRLFNDEVIGCARCHPAPLFTDLSRYDVGTRGDLDRTASFDTPTAGRVVAHGTLPARRIGDDIARGAGRPQCERPAWPHDASCR